MKKWIIAIGVIVLAICAIVFFVVRPGRDTVIDLKKDVAGKSVSINIQKGKNYLHDFKVNSIITIKTQPQIAIWVEDLQGNYIDTLYATSKIVYQNWSKSPSDPANAPIKREEALPYWTHKKGDVKLVPDTITSATPKGNSAINTKLSTTKEQYVVLAEVNMSTDFNEYYPKDAKPGDANYSGGVMGSGQPAIVYAATISAADDKTYELVPIGHSSSDGSNGNLDKDLSKLTTAKDIVGKITFKINK